MKITADLNKVLISSAVAALGLIGYFVIWWNHEIVIQKKPPQEELRSVSSLTGLPCNTTTRRPMAVMLASDPVARPLSGISQADVVVEMPVTPGPNEVTRMMAVFQCNEPPRIGSIRSARNDFIPLVAGFDAIYAHWGGESAALERLNSKVLDNVDALKYEGTTFYREQGIPRPHNGFTTLELLRDRAVALGYSNSSTFAGYGHRTGTAKRNVSTIAEIFEVPYAGPYRVRWEYDQSAKMYKRYRDGSPELDSTNGQQARAGAIVVVKTTADTIRNEYLDLRLGGQGEAILYQEGVKFNILWKKDPAQLSSMLLFFDSQGKEMFFAPGPLWIEVVVVTA